MTRVCVVGGGPAGLSAAIHAARGGASVTLLERNGQCGVKLLATGGGRCNVSNLRPPAEWPALFGRRGRFILPALAFLPLDSLKDFFAGIGQPLATPDGVHLFPASNSAKAVRDALVAEAARQGVDIRCGARVDGLAIADGGQFHVSGSGGRLYCDKLILAVGGRSYPATGSTGDGAVLARLAGYKTLPLVPGLVGLKLSNLSPDLAGLVLPDSEVVLKTRGKAALTGRRELLLTHGGVSGPAVLDLSATAAEQLGETDAASPSGEATLLIRWVAGMPPSAWQEKFALWRIEKGGVGVESLLRQFLPQRLSRWLCGQANAAGGVTAATVRADTRDRLAELLGAFPGRVVGSEGWEKAMITRGGVDTGQVDPKTLEGRLTRGLYFSGEALDVDGPCGGYNLHWAFASGALAGAAAADRQMGRASQHTSSRRSKQ